MPASFVHLRLHTEYSLVDGLVRIKPLVKTLVGMNMPAVAVTDQNNMCSLVKFYKNAMGAGIKPICGADLWLSNKDPDNALSRISLLVMNAERLSQPYRTDFPWFHRRSAQWRGHHRA
jgi:DNA polymerase-3 subunit alpha